jgi:hypothetical protein
VSDETSPDAWLRRFTPREWVRASMAELDQARRAYTQRNGRAGLAGCRRAAGVALNGLLASQPTPDPAYGRSYMEHLGALAADASAPDAVRDAAKLLLQTPLPGGEVVVLRTASTDARALDAAETVMAHALAMVMKAEDSVA